MGPSLVGFGSCRSLRYNTASKHEVGIRPNANIAYGLHEMAVYDPILPADYFRVWRAAGGRPTPVAAAPGHLLCPVHQSPPSPGVRCPIRARAAGPAPALRGGCHAGGDLRRRAAVLRPGVGAGDGQPGVGGRCAATGRRAGPAPGGDVPDAASWRVVVDEPTASIVRLRLTAVPGWSATIDGHPLALTSWADGLMLQAHVPAGSHVVELHYWPAAFSAGLAVAGAVVVGGVAVMTTGFVVGRRRRRVAPAP